jgi:hypothetical protein
MECCFVTDGEFVVPGGDSAVAFDAVDAALDGVVVLVDLGLEAGRSPAGEALVARFASYRP